ncbi:MAG: YihY family inner membrane protein [Myxococcota bacterium]
MVTDAPSNLGRAFSRLERFVCRGVWDIDYRKHRGVRRLLVRQLQVVLLAVKGMREDEVRLRAAGLTLITLLSVVPFLAVVFWVFQAFGGVEDLRSRVEPFIYENLAPGSQQEAIRWLNAFIDQIHTGAVGGIGTAILIVVAIGLLGSMEQSFNRIWGVTRGRPYLNRFVIYWCLLTVGPILLAASLAGTASVTGWLPLRNGLGALAMGVLPMGITAGAFTLFYMVVPNTRVSIKHAAVGGMAAGVLFEVAKLAYAWVAGNLFQYHAIYGSLGAVPVFIIWVNIAWTVVLFGCELTFANQNIRTLRHDEKARAASQKLRELVAARLMLEISVDFFRGLSPPRASVLAERLDAPVRLVREVLEFLRRGGLLLEVSGSNGEIGFAPARVLDRISLADVIWAMRARQQISLEVCEDERQHLLRELMGEAEREANLTYERHSFYDLAGRFAEGSEDWPREATTREDEDEDGGAAADDSEGSPDNEAVGSPGR